MYIRNLDEAMASLAEILEIPARRDQIIQATVRIMLCLDVDARLFLADGQALLIEGGLEALRARRRDAAEAEDLPVGVLDPEEDRLFEEVASALDALRFSEVVRRVFPALHADRWQIARALLLYESGVREQISAAIKGHADEAAVDAARGAVETMISALRPAWSDRLGAIRSACLETLKQSSALDADLLHQEAETLFELFVTSDERAPRLLEAIDQDAPGAAEQIVRLRDLAAAARALQTDPPPGTPGKVRDVA